MPVVKKVRFSDSSVRREFNTPKLFKKGNFEVFIKEAPGTSLLYYAIKKKYALEAAIKAAPGCTFDLVEFSGNHPCTGRLDTIAHLHPATITHLKENGVM